MLYDSTSATGIYEAMTMGIYSGILMVALTLYIMLTSFGNAPEVIVAGILVGPHISFRRAICANDPQKKPGESGVWVKYDQQVIGRRNEQCARRSEPRRQ